MGKESVVRGSRLCWALALPVLVTACGGSSFNGFDTAPAAGASGAHIGTGAGGSSSSGGAHHGSSGGASVGDAGEASDAGSSSSDGGAAPSGAGMGGSSSAGAWAGGSGGAPVVAGGSSSSAGAGAGQGGGPAGDPKRITVVGVFGGVNAIGSHASPPSNAQYTWPDARVKMWTNFNSGVALGPAAVTVDPNYLTSGVELLLGSDAQYGMASAGMVAIVKSCSSGQTIEKSNTLISDWAEPDSTQVPLGPIMSIYVSIMKQAGADLHKTYPKSSIRYAHVMILGEYDAQKLTTPAAALAGQIAKTKEHLTGSFPGSIIIATEPNAALTAWWPENAQVRSAFEMVAAQGGLYLVNADAIPPANASAQDPAYDVGQLLNLASKIEYGIQHEIETKWDAP